MSYKKTPELQAARDAVAERYAQPYTKRAILRGDWDTGQLVQNELTKIKEAK